MYTMYEKPSCLAAVFGLTIMWMLMSMSMCRADDVIVQMFSKRQLNQISDKYISYSVDLSELLDLYNDENSLYRLMELGPCYLKIHRNNTNQMPSKDKALDSNASNVSIEHFKNMYDALRVAGIKPVVVLPYNPNNWNIRNAIRILAEYFQQQINDIVWQLGADFQSENAINYVDDLNTLKLIVDAFSTKTNAINWSVVGSDHSIATDENEARIYTEFSKHTVDAVEWAQPIDLNDSDENVDDFFANINMDAALRTMLNGDVPVWLSLPHSKSATEQKTSQTQQKQGLNWAQTLGDAAKNGFRAIYLPIENNWNELSLSYYITLLHKRIIGRTVFETVIFKGNRYDSHFYAHCTKNMSGSFTLYGINAGDSDLDITAKLPFRSGTEYMEFILTINDNGGIYLNGQQIIEPSILKPLPKFKLPGKTAQLSMPANSIAFYIFTGAKLPECDSNESITFDAASVRSQQPRRSTSAERLLQELIIEWVQREQPEVNAAPSSNSNSNPNSESDPNAIEHMKNEIVSRRRRDISNRITKRNEYNAINLIADNELNQMRNKRFVRGGNMIINRIYSDIDDMKRRQLTSSYKNHFGFKVAKRMKRETRLLKSLFEKFDLKKPIWHMKSPTANIRLGATQNAIIPPITAVHDVFNTEHNTEHKLFEAVENPKLPTGDVHITMVDTKPKENFEQKMNAGPQAAQSIYVNDVIMSPEANPQQNLYGEFGPSAVINPPAIPSSALLEEMFVMNPTMSVAPNAKINLPMQHNIPFVVKDLPPTWQRNHDNMEKTRLNLQHLYWPIANAVNPLNANPKITNFNPIAQHIQLPQAEHIVFETRRRRKRRAIDSRMNDEIEAKVQRNKNDDDVLTDMTKNAELLDKMLRIIDSMDQSQNIDGAFNLLQKTSQNFKLNPLLAWNKNGNNDNQKTANDIHKKCRVLSMSIEHECLQVENQPKFLFKRNADIETTKAKLQKAIAPLKMLFGAIKDTAEKRNGRSKRDTNTVADEPDSRENYINYIPTESHYNDSPIKEPMKEPIKRFHEKFNDEKGADDPTETIPGLAEHDTNAKKEIPKFLRIVRNTVNKVMNVVTAQVSEMWHSMSSPF